MSVTESSSAGRLQIWGYVPNYDRETAWATVERHRQLLSGVSLFQYYLGHDGNLIEYPGMPREPAWVREQGLLVMPMVTNLAEDRWDRDRVAHVLGQTDVRRRHLDQLLEVVMDGYPGLELDYESLAPEDRNTLSSFVEELAAALHDRGKQLSLAVHAKLSEPGEGGGTQAQDWERLGRSADRIVVMTYDHDPSRPGPIAPIAWTREVLEFALNRIPHSRVIQGVPFYGYDWTDTGEAVYRTYAELINLAEAHKAEPRRDATDRHVVLEYLETGLRHEVWLPDAETVSTLVTVGRELNVGGYAIWRMGGEDPRAWGAFLQ